MAFAAKAIVLKPISLATNSSFVSIRSLFTPSKASFSNHSLSIQLKPIKFGKEIQLYLKRKEPLFEISVIAARHEEGNPVVLEEKEEEIGDNLGLNLSENGAENGEGELGLEESKVYVGNLPYDVDSETLAQLFEQAGVVDMSQIIYDRETNRSRGFGFVTMSTVEEAEKAVNMFHRHDMNGRSLAVYMAGPKGSRPKRATRATLQPAYRVYIGNLPWNLDDSRLFELFSPHGKVLSARVFTDRENGRSRGFGFVLMQTESERKEAIASLNGKNVDGREIRVDVAEEKSSRSSSF